MNKYELEPILNLIQAQNLPQGPDRSPEGLHLPLTP